MRNRVTPFGEIVDIPQRGTFTGNRGCLHRGREIVRPWQVRRWITCVLEFKGWHHEQWQPGTWTALFFADEAVAWAAGHRPCALCRRRDYERWRDAWRAAIGGPADADSMDRRLHADRLDGRVQRHHRAGWRALPDDVFVLVDGQAMRVAGDELRPWSAAGYGAPTARPRRGHAVVMTPAATVAVLGALRH